MLDYLKIIINEMYLLTQSFQNGTIYPNPRIIWPNFWTKSYDIKTLILYWYDLLHTPRFQLILENFKRKVVKEVFSFSTSPRTLYSYSNKSFNHSLKRSLFYLAHLPSHTIGCASFHFKIIFPISKCLSNQNLLQIDDFSLFQTFLAYTKTCL